MPYLHKFGPDDIFINRMITSPQYEFVMYSGSMYVNNDRFMGRNIPTGSISLYEYNVDRTTVQQLIYPFIIKDGSWLKFPNVTKQQYRDLEPGEMVRGLYPLTSSILRQNYPATVYPFPAGEEVKKNSYVNRRKEIIALQNVMNYYRYRNNNYHYTGSYVSGAVNMVQIPSIFYGSSIKPGSVSLKFYFTGALVDNARDLRQDGTLISTKGLLSGSDVGVVLYNEGFVLLTATGAIGTGVDNFGGKGVKSAPTWLDFGAYDAASISGSSGTYASASVFSLGFRGTQQVPNMTMFATAQAGDVSNSLNPTWLSSSNGYWRSNSSVNPSQYVEPNQLIIKNTIQSQYCKFEDEFEKQTFISEIGLFDENKNLIGVAQLANPVQKKVIDEYTFKLKLDM